VLFGPSEQAAKKAKGVEELPQKIQLFA